MSTMEQAGGQEAVSPAEPAKKAVSIDWKAPALWLSLWAAGAVGSLGFYVISYIRFRIRMRKSLLPPRESDLVVYNGFAGRRPELQRCKGLHTPILCGVLHPMLILPDRDYEDDVLRNILHHELTHYRRMDTLYKWFAVAVYAAQWFNPLIYWMRRELGQACELSCDEMLMRRMDRQERQNYGETLLSMAASGKEKSQRKAGTDYGIQTEQTEDDRFAAGFCAAGELCRLRRAREQRRNSCRRACDGSYGFNSG